MSSRPSTNSSRTNTAKHGRVRPGDRLEPAPDFNKASFQFAKIPYIEIQDDLSRLLQRNVTLEELKAPSSELIREVLTPYISEVFNKKPEDLTQPPFGIVDQLEYPELYDEAFLTQVIFLRYAQQLLSLASFDQFGLRDFFAPEKVRFHFQLSALVNFTRFRVMRLASHEDFAQQSEEKMERERNLLEEKAKLEQSIHKVKNERERERPKHEEIQEQISEKGLLLGTHHKQQHEITEKTNQNKQLLKTLIEEHQRLRRTLATDCSVVAKMEEKVVSSPAKVKAELDTLAEKLEAETEYVDSVHHRNLMLSSRYESSSKLITKAEHSKLTLDDIIDKVHSDENKIANVDRMKSKRQEVVTQNRAYEEMRVQLEKENVSLHSRLCRIVEQKNDMVGSKTDLDVKRADFKRVYQINLERKTEAHAEKQAIIDQRQKEIEDLVREEEKEIEDIKRKHQLLLERRVEFGKDMREVFDIFIESANSDKKSIDKLMATWKLTR